MNRSGSQKVLLVVSIIEIVFGVLTFIVGLMATLAGGALNGAMGGTPEEVAAVGILSTATSVFAVVLIVGAVLSVLEGILGVRAANDASKIMPVWILAIIALVSAVISLIMTIANGSFAVNGLNNIITLVLDGLMFWVANNIKVEAGK